MKLNILWLYHDIMDLYGDKGNIKVLVKRCKDRGIDVEVTTMGIDDQCVLKDYDVIFVGGGADAEQRLIYKDLMNRKDAIIEAINDKTFILLICGGYQLFGQYYLDQDNHKIEGLGIYDFYTEFKPNDGRCIGNIVIETTLDGHKCQLVGFENHGGQTLNVSTPFGKVLFGHGNEYKMGYEGFMSDQVIGTYMHGPLLPKNPELADYVIKKGLSKHHKDVVLNPLDDILEMKAKEILINRYLYNK